MPEIRQLVTIDAPVGVIFMALTEQDGVTGWWTTDAVIKPVIGSIAGFRFGDQYHNTMRVVTLDTNKRIEWICLDGHPEWVDTSFTFELESREGSTVVRFIHGDWRDVTDFYATCNYHWGFYLRSLKTYCETGTGEPYTK
jgi:uncharacterized protein YndB with AHSA1/START domain